MTECADLDLTTLLDADDECHEFIASRAAFELHVGSCKECQRRLAELAADEDQWKEAYACLTPDSPSAALTTDVQEARLRWQRPSAWTRSMAQSVLSPPVHPEMLGRIGRYDIESMIGSGGMGVVFKAFDTELNRPVAIKMLAPLLAESGPARQRFAREGRAAAAVVDDHVVPIYNVDSSAGQAPFLVMQYVSGGSLQQRLDEEGGLAIEEILRIGMQTAKGLAAAHAQGLIHRDVKPSNILLDENVDRALLTDFGLARAEDDACLTRSGFHPGTPHYMSPEQVRGEEIDHRSDLFGLGCVLYALCAGRPPFRAETSYAVMRRITDDPPRRIREINPAIPDWLEQVIMKLLAKTPGERFESAEHVAQLLEACLSHVQHPTAKTLPESVATLVAPKRAKTRFGKAMRGALITIGVVLATVMIVLELNKGTLTIESSQSEVPIRILRGDREYASMNVTAGANSIRVAAGEYVVEIDGGAHELVVDGASVSISRGEEQVVRITHRVDPPEQVPQSEQTRRPEPSHPSMAVREHHLIILPDQTPLDAVGVGEAIVTAAIQLVHSSTLQDHDGAVKVPKPNTMVMLNPALDFTWLVEDHEQSYEVSQIIIEHRPIWEPPSILVRADGEYRKLSAYPPSSWIAFRSALDRVQHQVSMEDSLPGSDRKPAWSSPVIEAARIVENLIDLYDSRPETVGDQRNQFPTRSPAEAKSLHIGFAYDPGQGKYDGVIGEPTDVWNFVDIGTTAVDYMRHADGSGSSARLRLTPFDGEWAVTTKNQIFLGYIYHNCRCVDLEAKLLDVPAGRYRIYVYAHGNAADQNANIELLIDDDSLGKKATDKSSLREIQSATLKEGTHYVTFDFEIEAGETIRIISHRDGSDYSMFNAIQLMPDPSSPR